VNIHHLELFYYVARHGGISEAVRHMPYGIQQPAVSDQVIQLEESLGVTLFQRRPFSLTPAGTELYQAIKPFFDSLTPLAEKLRGGASQHVRIAASEIVLQDYLPRILQALRKSFPKLKVTLREGYDPEVISWLERQEIDVAIGLLGAKPPPGIHALPLLRLPMALIVPQSSKLKSAEELWQHDRMEEALITVPSNEPVCRAFREGLAKLKVDWFSGIEVSTLEIVQTYVAMGYGIGLTVGVPGTKYNPQVRVLRLEGFPMPVFGVLWQGRPTSVVQALLDLVRRAVAELVGGGDSSLLLSNGEGSEAKARAQRVTPSTN
jgi:DNA-binding transcriptional LysR family regulator